MLIKIHGDTGFLKYAEHTLLYELVCFASSVLRKDNNFDQTTIYKIFWSIFKSLLYIRTCTIKCVITKSLCNAVKAITKEMFQVLFNVIKLKVYLTLKSYHACSRRLLSLVNRPWGFPCFWVIFISQSFQLYMFVFF